VWDDNDDAGLESVSEPDMDDNDERGTSTFTASPPGVHRDNDDDDDDDEEEMLRDDFTTTTKNAMEIESEERQLAALKAPAIARASEDHEGQGQRGGKGQEERTAETKPRPPKPRPLQSMGPIGTDTQSWIRPANTGHEAPNGKNVL
jgi:hypothetical protein